jgi:hypothetical protein
MAKIPWKRILRASLRKLETEAKAGHMLRRQLLIRTIERCSTFLLERTANNHKLLYAVLYEYLGKPEVRILLAPLFSRWMHVLMARSPDHAYRLSLIWPVFGAAAVCARLRPKLLEPGSLGTYLRDMERLNLETCRSPAEVLYVRDYYRTCRELFAVKT